MKTNLLSAVAFVCILTFGACAGWFIVNMTRDMAKTNTIYEEGVRTNKYERIEYQYGYYVYKFNLDGKTYLVNPSGGIVEHKPLTPEK